MPDQFSAGEIVRRADRLKADLSTYFNHCQEVADYLMPSREFETMRTPGEKRLERIYHTGPVMAAEQLAGARHGMETSPSLRWFLLQPDNPKALDDESVKAWFQDATERMEHKLSSPFVRFDLHIHEGYLDEAAFGTACLFMPDRGARGIGFQALPLKECFYSANNEDVIDVLFRCYEMRAYDVVNNPLWQRDIPDDVRRNAENRPDQKWECIHALLPVMGEKFAYGGQYLLKRSLTLLGKTEQYQDKPFIVSRWSKRSGETSGNGPGMNALPDVKMLNSLEREHLMGVMLANAPPLALPDDGFLSSVMQTPRKLNYYRADEPGFQDRVFPLPIGERPEVAAEKIADVMQRVRDAFYISWMNIPFKPNTTATEVLQRRDEMLRLMGPMATRSAAEKLGPIIERTFNVMWRNGELSPPPTSLSGLKWRVEYVSPLMQAQKTADAQGALAFLQGLAQVAPIDPNVVDVVDGDEYARFLADRMGVPLKTLRNEQAIADIRQARAQRQQQMEQAQAIDTVTKGLQQGGAGAASLAQAGESLRGAVA